MSNLAYGHYSCIHLIGGSYAAAEIYEADKKILQVHQQNLGLRHTSGGLINTGARRIFSTVGKLGVLGRKSSPGVGVGGAPVGVWGEAPEGDERL